LDDTTATASEVTTVADTQPSTDDKPVPGDSATPAQADTGDSLQSKDVPPSAKISADTGDHIDATELEKDKLCKDMREKVKRKFLVDMPEDFYQFWDFCKSLDPTHPEKALVQSVGLELAGPYHVLAGKLDGVTWEKCTLHSRFFYDPPEMVTVVKRSSDQFHLGFFR
jgi:hypothetical protein